ncbi:related to cellulose 1,4-beta-cellobiosidase II precursor [Rhynchosporium agropyri]|uniref:Glucanase n=1 Tax=Rhynchosporium agropyri TaxID=914238 RepID=A0A1E1LMG4_9HELO|nr:related to cellulose 1,4-beta-cellobiosidase II precursor [Rhynchosporium agropyri]
MLYSSFLAALGGISIATAYPSGLLSPDYSTGSSADVNPFVGKNYYANSIYAAKLDETIGAFTSKGDTLNAGRAKTVKSIGTFLWVASVADLTKMTSTIKEALAEQQRTKKKQIVQLVHYNLPDRDCSAGESSGEYTSANNGLALYKKNYVDPFAAAVKAAPELTFAVILEPDSLGNAVTNLALPFCAGAAPGYEEGIAYAISKLQSPNVHLYMDAGHGGWLGWDNNLPLAAAEFAKVLKLAQKKQAGSKIRGFSTDVSNFNPYVANPRANYTQFSHSYDEKSYAESLAPFLTNQSLPAHFIVDQGRSGLQNTRPTWGDWCNVKAGFGHTPTTVTNSSVVDSIVWVKPGGESDGACGPKINGQTAPKAGMWWNDYVMELVKNANPPLKPSS